MKNTVQAMVRQIHLAFVLLSRLPMPHLADDTHDRGARAVWAYPVVGAVLGVVAAAFGGLLGWIGFGPAIVAGGMLGLMAVLTGALHEDGLADTADGLWGGWTRERRLAIMKDSHIGTYGVLALIFVTALRWAALSGLPPAAFVAAASLSRAAVPGVMAALPHARTDGLSHSVGRPTPARAGAAVLISCWIALAIVGTAAIPAICTTAFAALVVGAVARTKIGGQTGDILGAVQQLAEIAVLLTLLAIL